MIAKEVRVFRKLERVRARLHARHQEESIPVS